MRRGGMVSPGGLVRAAPEVDAESHDRKLAGIQNELTAEFNSLEQEGVDSDDDEDEFSDDEESDEDEFNFKDEE